MTTMQPVSWREERRRDRMTDAQIGREQEAARAQGRLAGAEAQARLQREQDAARSVSRKAARKQRALRRAERAAWLREHVTGLLFVPVIVVPGVLAWTAMAAYGRQVFGTAGVSLPAFSEGAMWAFAGATTITRHRHPDRPVWHLRLGTVVSAAVGATMNFIHGSTPGQGQLRGLGTGLVMALISVAGVVAHQLITAGPRRSRSERENTRAGRASERRARAVRRAARRGAVASLDADGNARLVYEPATVTLARRWGRVRLEDAPQRVPVQAADAAPEAHAWPRPAPVLSLPEVPQTATPEVPQMTVGLQRPAASKPAARKPQSGTSKPSEKRAAAERLMREDPGISTPELVARSGVSKATADRIRSQVPGRRLHVAGGF